MIRRRRIARIVALIVGFAMLPQFAIAQAENCAMKGTHASGDHGGMMQHRDLANGTASGKTSTDGQHSSGITGCSQNMICANVAIVTTKATRAFHIDGRAPQISFGRHVMESRTLRPDPPPPRI